MAPCHRVLTTLCALAASLAIATPGHAANRVTPGSFTGYGFDQCVAPTQEAMDTWLTTSPYWAVGIYIAGVNRYCGDDKQVNLDATWVDTQLRNGWRLLPLTVGLQASCSDLSRYRGQRISADPTNNYARAREQGRLEARTTVQAATRLGIAQRSTLWFDLEHFSGGEPCEESALAFLSAWTNQLHALNYVSGVYSSASSGIRLLDEAQANRPGRYTMPDRVWIADWNGRADVHSDYIRPGSWMPHSRVHQYDGGHNETHGGVTINIDSNYMSLGRGSVAPPEGHHCGVPVNFGRYRRQLLGREGDQVRALQCMLRQRKLYDGRLTGVFNERTEAAVERFEAARGLRVTGRMSRHRWGVMLSRGTTPVVKIGSASHAVRRLQRTLNALGEGGVAVTGLFDATTTAAVRAYQRAVGLPVTGVVAGDTWAELRAGHTTPR